MILQRKLTYVAGRGGDANKGLGACLRTIEPIQHVFVGFFIACIKVV